MVAYLLTLEHFNSRSLPLSYCAVSWIALSPGVIYKFRFTTSPPLFTTATPKLLLFTGPTSSALLFLIWVILSFWVILFTLATTYLPVTPTFTFFFSPEIQVCVFLTISYTLQMDAPQAYQTHVQIWTHHIFSNLLFLLSCLILSWSI